MQCNIIHDKTAIESSNLSIGKLHEDKLKDLSRDEHIVVCDIRACNSRMELNSLYICTGSFQYNYLTIPFQSQQVTRKSEDLTTLRHEIMKYTITDDMVV